MWFAIVAAEVKSLATQTASCERSGHSGTLREEVASFIA
jgi:hypothetical protein